MRNLKIAEANYADPKSTLCDKKLFRINPETQQPYGKPTKHKKSKLILLLTPVLEPTFI